MYFYWRDERRTQYIKCMIVWYNIAFKCSLSVTCDRSVIFSRYSGFFHQ